MIVENAVSGSAPKSPVSVQLDLDLATETAMAYGLHRFHAHQTIQSPLVPYGWRHFRPGRDQDDRNDSPLVEGDHSEWLIYLLVFTMPGTYTTRHNRSAR